MKHSFRCRFSVFAMVVAAFLVTSAHSLAAESIPDKLVVLTFDDSASSHYTVAAPLLKDYGFGATFFITEGFDFKTNKKDYMTWKQIAELHRMGFEIGNHTRDHVGINDKAVPRLQEQLDGIATQCKAHGIPRAGHVRVACERHVIESVSGVAKERDQVCSPRRRAGVSLRTRSGIRV